MMPTVDDIARLTAVYVVARNDARAAAGLPSAHAEAELHRAMERARADLAAALRVAAKGARRSFADASDIAIVAAHLRATVRA